MNFAFWKSRATVPTAAELHRRMQTLETAVEEAPGANDGLVAVLLAAPEEHTPEEISFDEEYQTLARKHGVARQRSILKRSRLHELLQSEAIPIFDHAKVASWLDAHTPRYHNWHWYPLRCQDSNFLLMKGRVSMVDSTNGTPRQSLYSKPVPLPVLQTMDRLDALMPEELCFFVSDIVDEPDPFLAVAERENLYEFYIIERWDEPGFRR